MRKRRVKKKEWKRISEALKEQERARRKRALIAKQTFGETKEVASVIDVVNQNREWKNPLKAEAQKCLSIQQKIKDGRKLTLSETNHMSNCDSCAFTHK